MLDPHSDIEEILYSEEEIKAYISKMGEQITKDYAGEDLVVIAVLRGAAIFLADLVREIKLPVEIDFMAVSSYGSEAQTSGVIDINKDLTTDIAGRNVLIAEDILDSGLTLECLVKNLSLRGPKSLAVATLFEKQDVQQVEINCKYPGLPVPDAFVVGFGLDYAQHYRNLPYLGVLKPCVYE